MGQVGPDLRGLRFGLVVSGFVCGAYVPLVVFHFHVFVLVVLGPGLCFVLALSRFSVGLFFPGRWP